MKASVAFSFLFLLLLKSIFLFGQQGQWTWMKGDSTVNSPGHYGTQGIPDSLNTPPALYEANGWTDLDGNFWLFGGEESTLGHPLGALWKFDISLNQWIWINGTNSLNQYGVYGVQGVPSPLNTPGGRACGIFT